MSEAVVSVQVRGAAPSAAPGTSAQMAQRKKRFDPGVLAVQAGTAVAFPNFDTVRHHVYSFSAIKTFELKLYAATPAAPVVFDKPGTAVLGCNIHDTMTSFVRVVDTPYFAKTGADGKALIDVPAGSHSMKVWHPGLAADREPAAQAVTVAGGGSAVTVSVEGP
jgi:plastocyanin